MKYKFIMFLTCLAMTFTLSACSFNPLSHNFADNLDISVDETPAWDDFVGKEKTVNNDNSDLTIYEYVLYGDESEDGSDFYTDEYHIAFSNTAYVMFLKQFDKDGNAISVYRMSGELHGTAYDDLHMLYEKQKFDYMMYALSYGVMSVSCVEGVDDAGNEASYYPAVIDGRQFENWESEFDYYVSLLDSSKEE